MSVILSAMSNHRQELVPHDIGKHILSYLDNQTILRYERVCKQALDEAKPCWIPQFEKIRAGYLNKLQSRVKTSETLLTIWENEIVELVASIQSSRRQNTTMSREQMIERRNTLLQLEKTQKIIKTFYEKKVRETAQFDTSSAKSITIFYSLVRQHLEDFNNKDLFAYILSFAPCKTPAIVEKAMRFNHIYDALPYQFYIVSKIEHDPITSLKLSWNDDEGTAQSLSYHNRSSVSVIGGVLQELHPYFKILFWMLGDCTWEYL